VSQENLDLLTAEQTREATIDMRGIGKRYSGVAALTDVSVVVRPGEVHAILGENGAGKSTLMGIATGTTAPDEGTITVGGQTLTALNPTTATALGIAIVHQHPAVLPDMTVLENLLVALPASVFAGQSTKTLARNMLDGVGLRAHLGDRVETLTLAEKHLLEIAKAFAVRPKLLVLDEPTAPLGGDAVALLSRWYVRPSPRARRSCTSPTGWPRCVNWRPASRCCATAGCGAR